MFTVDFDCSIALKRDRREQTVYAPGNASATGITMAVGVAAWAAFVFWLHRVVIGVSPLAVMDSLGCKLFEIAKRYLFSSCLRVYLLGYRHT